MPLQRIVSPTIDESANGPLIVLLHGRGSDEHDLQGLRTGLPSSAVLVTPRAPFPGAAWGYGGGWAWYRFVGGTSPDAATFAESQSALDGLISELRDEFGVARPIVLGGFSQGGTMALGYALRHPGTLDGLLMFSGFLATHDSLQVSPESTSGLRLFWGHGLLDQMIPHAWAVAGRAALRGAGAEVTARDYRSGHWIEPEELVDARAWLDASLRPEAVAR